MANKGREVKVGAVVYRSFEKYFESAKRMAEKQGRPAPSYMTLYMRVRKGTSAASAMAKPVRKYNKRVQVQEMVAE